MPDGADIFEQIGHRFGNRSRPDDYIDRGHCDECEEHYQELVDVSVDSIGYSHVENPGWDPTCFLSPSGFQYYFPGLVRIADEHPEDFREALVMRLTGHYVELFDAGERALVRRLLEYWWADNELPEWDRLAIEQALGHYRAD